MSGFNVYPGEVEEALAEHPDVADVAVVGEPHPRTGETVVAFVVPSPGAHPDPVELLRHAGRRLARYKLPTRVEVVDGVAALVRGQAAAPRVVRGRRSDARLRGRRHDEARVDHRDTRRERDRERFVVTDDALEQPAARQHERAERDQRVAAREPSAARRAQAREPHRRPHRAAEHARPRRRRCRSPASARGSASKWSLPIGNRVGRDRAVDRRRRASRRSRGR